MMKWINKKRNRKGFTLVELVVVIAILGILAAIAVPKLGGFSDGAKRAKVEAEHRQIVSAIQMWQSNTGDFDTFPELDDLEDYFDDLDKIKATKTKAGDTKAHEISGNILTSTWDDDVSADKDGKGAIQNTWIYPAPETKD